MNINTYGSHYGEFHRCNVSELLNNIIVFDLGHSPYETWTVTRMIPSRHIAMNCEKPLVQALKCYFKSDVPASVVSNKQYLWTVCLGKEKMVYPVSRPSDQKTESHTADRSVLYLYATTYFVKDPRLVRDYIQSAVDSAYENIYFYKSVLLYLDDQDLPFPGGYYFDRSESVPYYRICFLTTESIDHVSKLAAEWQSRRDVLTIPCMTRTVIAHPKFINFQPVVELGFSESSILSNGVVQRKLSSRKPEFVIQDILLSYYKNFSREELKMEHLGLVLEWPILVTFEGSFTVRTPSENRKVVALSINGNLPNRVLHVMNPYDRFVEYNEVPATLWTSIHFVPVVLALSPHYSKVVLDTIVIGVVYRETFFCFNQPLLEGRPTKQPVLNTQYLLSVAPTEWFRQDCRVKVVDTFRHDERHSLHRVGLTGIPYETWCLTEVENTDPYPHNYRLPNLVQQWLTFFKEVRIHNLDIDINVVRLALTLSQQNICYSLDIVKGATEPVHLSDTQVKLNLSEGVVQFINDVRLMKPRSDADVEESACSVS